MIKILIKKGVLCLMLLSGLSTAHGGTVTKTFFHSNAQGSIVAASNEQGDVIWRKTYDAYGNEVVTTEGGNEYEGQAYTGKPFDEETGLLYLNQRYYDPQMGRFMSMDPVGFTVSNPTSFNRYAYANNNPYRFIDPDGRQAITPLFLKASQRGVSAHEAMASGARFRMVSGTVMTGGALGGGSIVGAAAPGALAWAFANPSSANTAVIVTAEIAAGDAMSGGALRNGIKNIASKGLKALPAPRQIEAAWSASRYRHGGLMTAIEHINYRHAFNSGFSNVSRFAKGTSVKDIRSLVDSALRYGNVAKNGKNGFTVEFNLGRTIGTNSSGGAATSIRVHVRDGNIQTAFPF